VLQIWALRRSVMGALQERLFTHTMHTMMRLTDKANTLPKHTARARTPRARKSDAVAAMIFSGPPVLPFVRPLPVAAQLRPEKPSEDWGSTPAGALSVLAARRAGLSDEHLQRISVAQHYWPADFASMSGGLQRQVLGECMHYCHTGVMVPSTLFGDEPPDTPRPDTPRGAAAAPGVKAPPIAKASPAVAAPRPPTAPMPAPPPVLSAATLSMPMPV